jgi:FlgD Ig-like domain
MKKLLLSFIVLFAAKASYAQPVYADVAGIFHASCGKCHNTNSHGPNLLTYSNVLTNVSNIQTHLTSGYMPPWLPDTTYTRFAHENLISAANRAAILNWIAAGSLPGDTTLAPTPPTYPEYQLYGTPDLELQIPTFTSNAVTDDSYVCFSLPTGLATDRIVRAYEVVPGNNGIVHHVIVDVDTMGTSVDNLAGNCYSTSGDFSLGGYAPGAPPTVFPNSSALKMGIKIKAGSKLILQIHYPLGSDGELDSTKIRLYFYPIGETGVRPVQVTTPLQNWFLNIPANTLQTFTAMYPASAATLSFDMSIFATFPHGHKITSAIKDYAYTATDTIPLINIPKWDFNWQGYYTFKNMVKVPAGYKLKAIHDYDNTSANPFNPSSPPVNVGAGTSTNDEMLFDSFQWLYYQPGDEFINVDSILALDPLINSVTEISVPKNNALNTYAYPNPFNQNVNIGYELKESSTVNVSIYTVTGKCIRNIQNAYETSGKHEVVWDGKNNAGTKMSNGTYFYIVKTNENVCNGKVMLMGK